MDIFFFFFFFFFLGGGGGGSLRNWTSVLFCFIFLFFFLGGGGGSFLYILGLFKVRYRMRIFFGAAKFQIFFGMPDIPDFFLIFFIYFFFGGGGGWGLTVNAGSKPLYEEKLRVPHRVSLGTDLYFYSSLVWRARN